MNRMFIVRGGKIFEMTENVDDPSSTFCEILPEETPVEIRALLGSLVGFPTGPSIEEV